MWLTNALNGYVLTNYIEKITMSGRRSSGSCFIGFMPNQCYGQSSNKGNVSNITRHHLPLSAYFVQVKQPITIRARLAWRGTNERFSRIPANVSSDIVI